MSDSTLRRARIPLTLYSEVSADTAVNDFGKSYTLKGVAGVRMAF